ALSKDGIYTIAN
ncbi:Pau11p, partial [Saccharomyces cerevisiae YJM244]